MPKRRYDDSYTVGGRRVPLIEPDYAHDYLDDVDPIIKRLFLPHEDDVEEDDDAV